MLRASRILRNGSLRVRYLFDASSSDNLNAEIDDSWAEKNEKPIGTVDGVKFEKINITVPGKGLADDVHCMVNKES